MVVEKFVLQLEAQLADRDVTIELTDEAAQWLIANGYDELMGARPMARVIQEHIKKPLADEVLFGRLKSGGHVRVVVVTDEAGKSKLGFEYPDGPVKPRPEKLPEPRRAKKRRSSPRRKPPGGGPGGDDRRRAAARCRRCRWSRSDAALSRRRLICSRRCRCNSCANQTASAGKRSGGAEK